MKQFINSAFLIKVIAAWLAISTGGVVIIAMASGRPVFRAVILMGLGLVLLWIALGGWLMRLLRGPVRTIALSIQMNWQIKFILFATGLALLEEVVTTWMTNLAPVFGVPLGAAYITASANYFDVVCLHSVVVFIPMFIGWAFLLKRYDFSPNLVFLLFGLTGTVIEGIYSGGQGFAEFGLWIFVYGLMVYLPAYCLPAERGAKAPHWQHYVLAVFLPIVFALPVAAVIGIIHPIRVHFQDLRVLYPLRGQANSEVVCPLSPNQNPHSMVN